VVVTVESLSAEKSALAKSGTPQDVTVESGQCLSVGGKMCEGLLQPMHVLLILGIALLIFGPRKLPELGKGLGEGIRKFKSGLQQDSHEFAPSSETESRNGAARNI
jgi:sec-independent protein translocase protein TatA